MKNSFLFGALSLSVLFACQTPAEQPMEQEQPAETAKTYDKGYQLYTIREALTSPEAIAASLKETKALGYNKMESFGFMQGTFLGMPVTDFKQAVVDAELGSPSGHYLPMQLEGDVVGPIDTATIADFLDAAQALNQHWVIIPWMSEAWRNAEGYSHLVNYLKLLGAAAKERGMVAAWHNHDFEFQPLHPEDPASPKAYEYLLSELEGTNVVFQMDVHWVAFAGENPVEWINNYPGRFPLWHVKDFAADTATQIPVGQGVIPWEEIFAAAETSGLEHYYIEQDFCAADRGIECLKESIEWADQQAYMD
jgi:sugar phosphate isomerase/epimerase